MSAVAEVASRTSVAFSTVPYRSLLAGRHAQRLVVALSSLAEDFELSPRATRAQVIERAWKWQLEHRRDDPTIRSLLFAGVRAESPAPKASAFAFELRAAGGLVDFVDLAEGAAEGFEIKSTLDSLSRLPGQIRSYRQVFSRLSLIVDERMAHRFDAIGAENGLGVVVVTGSGSAWGFERTRSAHEDFSHLSLTALLNTLRRDELRAVTYELSGVESTAPPGRAFLDAERLLKAVPVRDVASAVYRAIARRRRLNVRTLTRGVPAPLRAIVAEIDPPAAQLSDLRDWLNAEV